MFQHTAARRRLALDLFDKPSYNAFQHTAARRRLGTDVGFHRLFRAVSTHSRPKAAGSRQQGQRYAPQSFNTQPPEGGWGCWTTGWMQKPKFQHTAARRRLALRLYLTACLRLFQHTAARRRLGRHPAWVAVVLKGFNTQPPEGGWGRASSNTVMTCLFQHTAARRRLGPA